jgi:hypothetical protein
MNARSIFRGDRDRGRFGGFGGDDDYGYGGYGRGYGRGFGRGYGRGYGRGFGRGRGGGWWCGY